MTVFVTGLRGLPNVQGGVESHCEELLPRVRRTAPEIDITVLGRSPYVGKQPQTFEGVQVVPLPSPQSMHFEAIVSTFIAVLYARIKGAKVVHIHAIGPALLAPFARLLGLKVVVTHHGEDYRRAKWGKTARFALKWGERAALIWAHKVIAVSRSLETRLKDVFPQSAHKVVYIPNGATRLEPEPATGETLLRELGLEPGGYILAVARLVPEKGIHDLIAAFEMIRDESGVHEMIGNGAPPKLAIVGSADHNTPYARELLEKAGEDVLFLGFKPRSVLARLYEHCHCFVLPSHHEALPMVALEAASSGASVLLSDIEANRNFELREERYFVMGDPQSLVSKLLALPPYEEREAEDMMSRFDWEKAAVKTGSVYRSLMPSSAHVAPLARPEQDSTYR